MKRLRRLGITVAVFLALAGSASAGVIASYRYSGGGGFYGVHYTGHAFFYIEFTSDRAGTRIFDNIITTPVDEGSTFTVGRTTDDQFDAFLVHLTNGVDEGIQYGARNWAEPQGGLGAISTKEGWSLAGDTPERIDLHDYEITSLSVTLTRWWFASPGSDPNNNGLWTDYDIDFTVTANYVPEPAGLGALGLVFLVVQQRRRR